MRSSMPRRITTFVACSAMIAGAAFATSAVASSGHRSHRLSHHEHSGGGPKHASGALFVSPTGSSSNSGDSCAQARYSTIQSAVTAAAPSSTVIVCSGTYAEDVAVNEALTLSGEDAVINATGKNNGIVISASNVSVDGFTVRGAIGEGILAIGTADPSLVPAGSPTGSITGVPISDVTITHNIVQGNDQGPPTSSYGECQPNGQIPGDCGEGIHLMSVADSTVSHNYVTGNSGGMLFTDEFGPTHGNVIEHNLVSNNASDCGITLPSHNGLAVNPTTLAPTPSLGGVYDNTIRDNIVLSNGLTGFGAGVLFAAPFPGSASYDNVVEGNLIENNGIAGVTLHSHAPGAFIGGNQILHNLIGVNNVTGDTPLSPATGPFAAPVQFQADMQTTGILVWSLVTPTAITIADNTILGDAIGVWMNPAVSDPTAASSNTFHGVATPVGP
jgi:nitrous oxidase accessory protein NosD